MNAEFLTRPRLLVVDDQPINIQILYQALTPEFQVLKAADGEQALQLCRRLRPELVLLDVVMPGMDGHEVCRRLKADALTRDIPVIFVTAQDDAGEEALGLELGAADFIAKPVNAAVVRARVRTHLGYTRARSLLAATLESTADGILVTTPEGRISGMNGRFASLWNIPPELLDGAARDRIPAFMQDQVADAGQYGDGLARVLRDAGAGPGAGELIELRDERQLERHATPLRINARASGHVFSFRDVTERRRAASQLQRLNETLESRIAQRTRDLEQALQRADAANRAKSDFLSNMSHEIRTPMNAIIGVAWLALQGDPPPPLREQLQKIQGAGRHLLGLVTDILDFSKIEAGKLGLDKVDFDLAAVFDSVADQLGTAARDKGLRLLMEIDPALPRRLHGDPQRIAQVLLNYVGNAIKFSAAGDVRLRAVAGHGAGGVPALRLEVEDSGIGIAAEQLPRLFAPFHQADASTTRVYGGTGLGLAVCKQLAALMGGEVGVHSEPGRGSRFWLTIALDAVMLTPHDGGSAAAASVPAPMPALADCRQRIAGKAILLVDDNEFNRELTASLLQHVGARVDCASEGRQALDLLQAQRYDCVLMDVQMPVMDGLQATRLLRERPQLAGLPVLALTANASDGDRLRCRQAGMDDFMTKPIDPERLYATLAHWLQPAAGAGLRAAPVAPAEAAPQAAAAAEASADAATAAAAEPQSAAAAAVRRGIDLSILAFRVEGNAERFRRYASLFAESLPASLAELEDALALGDLARLAGLGHRMKSSASMVGALDLAAHCQALESLHPGGTLAQARAIVDKLPLMSEAIRADIQQALA